MSSNQNWKKGGGKTKRGKPTGRREVIEKYKSIGYGSFERENRKVAGIAMRVGAYRDTQFPRILRSLHARLRRHGNGLALRDQLLSVEDEASPREVEDEAREEASEMWRGIHREWELELAEKLDCEWFAIDMGLEDIDWLGLDYGDKQDEFFDRLDELMDRPAEEKKRSCRGLVGMS